jgi:aspartyl-tRNA(Asn)/glutamyl-tRNA(Gln) amidotransferase subunit C
MQVNDALILKLEKLARLQLDPDARTRMSTDLEKILQMVDKLQSLDTTGVEPLIYLSDALADSAAADDVAHAPMTQSDALHSAPMANDAYFLVPKVIG